jgi:hypothetical protein
MRDVFASCWYVPWLREGCQDRLVGSASMDEFVAQLLLCYELIYGRTPCQPVLTAFLQPRHNYQHEAKTSRSRQLLMMGTWLPETC